MSQILIIYHYLIYLHAFSSPNLLASTFTQHYLITKRFR